MMKATHSLRSLQTSGLLVAVVIASLFCACSSSRQTAVASDDVNIGYGSVAEDRRTNAVSKLDLNNKQSASYTTIYDYLRGRVPGLYVGNATTGGKPEMRIRGINSASMSNEPLILVNGIEMNDISNISPSSVRSVEVLKDASSSIYGMRGANGVILITLK